EDGSFKLNQEYFSYLTGLRMTSEAFHRLFGGPPRAPESLLTQRDMDLARSVQDACAEVLLRMARTAHRVTGSRNLCLAGGVALNCVANARILEEGPFGKLWIQPAAGDAGGCIGAAGLVWHRHLEKPRHAAADGGGGCHDGMRGSLLGPSLDEAEIAARLTALGARFARIDEPSRLRRVAALLAEGKVVGWFQGRAEFGPRALGARSILADPRRSDMQSQLNLKIKF